MSAPSGVRHCTVDALRAAVSELAASPSAQGADGLIASLAVAEPSPQLATFLTETLELPALHEVRDSHGVPLRWRLVDRLLGLGFPHALTVSPEDLEYHRSRSGRGGFPLAAALTMAAAFISSLWSLSVLALVLAPPHPWSYLLDLATAGSCAIHGIAAFISALRASRGERAPALGSLGLMFFLLPAIAALGGRLAVVVGAPAMITASLCVVTAARRSRYFPVTSAARQREADHLHTSSTPVSDSVRR
jgi:hypothetical protein